MAYETKQKMSQRTQTYGMDNDEVGYKWTEGSCCVCYLEVYAFTNETISSSYKLCLV